MQHLDDHKDNYNLNYNIAYCLFLPGVAYYVLQTHDVGALVLATLTLLSFSSLFSPKSHRLLHFILALTTIFDLVAKILVALNLLPWEKFVEIDTVTFLVDQGVPI